MQAPHGCASASSFNRELLTEMGRAIGEACQAEGVGVILGPAVNIKRSPLCGRNFEYYSEDPYVAGEMAASYIKGVTASSSLPSFTAFSINLSLTPHEGGISRSSPALTPATRSLTAPQSLTTKPSKPHSSLNTRILQIVYRFMENRDKEAVFDKEKQHEFSRKVAEESLVLLKNDGILPLKKEQKIAFIGQYAKKPRYQGGGSSHINILRGRFPKACRWD